MIKVELLVGGLKYNVSNDLKNWEEIEVALKREDYGGVIRSFGNNFEFVRGAYSLLENEYNLNYLNFKAVVIISILNSELSWNEKYRNDLDVTTYKADGYSVTINAKDHDLANLIKAGKSQTYDIPVDSLLPNFYVNYGRLELKNRANWFVNPPSQTDEESSNGIYSWISYGTKYSIPLAHGESNFPVKGKIEVFDVALDALTGEYAPISDYALARAITDQNITLDADFDVKLTALYNSKAYTAIIVFALYDKENKEKNRYSSIIMPSDIENGYVHNVNKSINFSMSQGDYILMFIELQGRMTLKNEIYNVNNISVTYAAKNKTIQITGVSPDSLLSDILYRIAGRQVKCSIKQSHEVNVNPGAGSVMLLAAESIRNIPNAKIHTSFSKFAEWMETVFGYTYTIENDEVVFEHRNSFFDSSQLKELDYVNNLALSIESKLIYSGVEVGYEKNEYDEINGRDEFHVKNSYKTGVSATDNILKLISPYRADCYGIEFLANKRDEETKDSESDNDLFFVHVRQTPGYVNVYDLFYTYGVSGVLFPNSVFNVAFSPRNMLLNNKRYIGACTSNLIFTASEGNADFAENGVSEKDAVSIPEPLFRVEKISIDTPGLSPFPVGYRGLIAFEYNGITYKGFIEKIDENMGTHEATTYNLISQSIGNT